MVSLGALKRTLATTKNPTEVLALKWSKNRKKVSFRNGSTFQLTWPQFRIFRDNYSSVQKYNIIQEEDDLFKIKDAKSEVTCSACYIPLICNLLEKYTIRQNKPQCFHVSNQKIDLVGSIYMLGCLQEQQTGEYDYDYENKVTLDVGGFEGESAVFFHSRGAKKVVIYEPVPAHVELIKRNTSKNRVNAEIHEEGIGDQDGSISVSYNETDSSFGLPIVGQKEMKIKVKSATKVILESNASVAKFDCEGAEKALVKVPTEVLRRIQCYIIETHSTQIKSELLEKFLNSGFTLRKEMPKNAQISVLTFSRCDH